MTSSRRGKSARTSSARVAVEAAKAPCLVEEAEVRVEEAEARGRAVRPGTEEACRVTSLRLVVGRAVAAAPESNKADDDTTADIVRTARVTLGGVEVRRLFSLLLSSESWGGKRASLFQ